MPGAACLIITPLSAFLAVLPMCVDMWAHAPVPLEHLPGLQPRYWERRPPNLLNGASALPLVAPWLPSLSSPSTASALFADAVGLQPDARGVATSLGLNERLFVVNPQEVHELVGTDRQGAGLGEELCLGGGRGGCWRRVTQRREGGLALAAMGP